MSYKPHHNKYDRQISSFGKKKKTLPQSYLYKQRSVDSKSYHVPPDMMWKDIYTTTYDVCVSKH